MDYKDIGKWIEKQLVTLGNISEYDGGIWRAAYTENEKKGKEFLKEIIKELDLECYEDALGDIYARLPGKKQETILIGSHIDTVKDGGRYDGAAGVVVGIAALGYLKKIGYTPERTIEVVGLLEEEGSRYPSSCHGSRGINGLLKPEHLMEKDADGITYYDAMKKAGYDPEKIDDVCRKDIAAYVELHIEQGAVLESENIQIGVVDGIVGIVNYDVLIKGQQNHAGTTPMNLRKDPVTAACSLISKMTEEVKKDGRKTVATFGKIQSYPGMQNVIADSVFISLDMRDINRDTLKEMENYFLKCIDDIKNMGFDVSAKQTQWSDPVKMDDRLMSLLAEAATEEKVTNKVMSSGAGHDAMVFAEYLPTAMIFVPSENGISHNPAEYTSPEDLEAGFRVLRNLIMKVDKSF